MTAAAPPGRILVVCTGNICRSPYIALVLQRALDSRWGSGAIEVTSAGIPGLQGVPMDDRAAARVRATGADPTGHRARRLTAQMVDGADLVLTAERHHRAKVALLCPPALRRSFAYLDFADLGSGVRPEALPQTHEPAQWLREVVETVTAQRGVRLPLTERDSAIADPYGLDDEDFDLMARQIDAATPEVVRLLTGR